MSATSAQVLLSCGSNREVKKGLGKSIQFQIQPRAKHGECSCQHLSVDKGISMHVNSWISRISLQTSLVEEDDAVEVGIEKPALKFREYILYKPQLATGTLTFDHGYQLPRQDHRARTPQGCLQGNKLSI